MPHLSTIALAALLGIALANLAQAAEEEKVALTITGGHETDPHDHGRPVILIAHALGVSPEVFREAFSHVSPAPAGKEPGRAQVQRNKQALLNGLSRYGVTNELLDRVSDYYRYPPGDGRLWPTTKAAGYVTLKNGSITSIKIIESGAGYTSLPAISIRGNPEMILKPVLAFGRDLKKNGSLSAITVENSEVRGR
jgi:hypothetical protein